MTAGEKRQAVGYLYELIKGGMRWLILGLIGQAGLPLMSKGSPKSRYCGDLRLRLVSSRGSREVQKQDRRTDTKTRVMSRAVTDV